MTIFFLCVITAPFFLNTFYNPAHETIDDFFETYRRITVASNYMSRPPENITAAFIKFVNIGSNFSETPIIEFESDYYNYSVLDSLNLRRNEMYVYQADRSDTQLYMKMIVSRKAYNSV